MIIFFIINLYHICAYFLVLINPGRTIIWQREGEFWLGVLFEYCPITFLHYCMTSFCNILFVIWNCMTYSVFNQLYNITACSVCNKKINKCRWFPVRLTVIRLWSIMIEGYIWRHEFLLLIMIYYTNQMPFGIWQVQSIWANLFLF